MKVLSLALLFIFAGCVLSCKKINLQAFELGFNNTGKPQKLNLHYKNESLNFHQLNSTNVSSTIFKLIWEFSSPEEAKKGNDTLNLLKPFFEEVKIDKDGLLVNFFGHHLTFLKDVHRFEFGTMYKFRARQFNQSVDISVMFKGKNQTYEQEFDSIIRQIFPGNFTTPNTDEIKFLEY